MCPKCGVYRETIKKRCKNCNRLYMRGAFAENPEMFRERSRKRHEALYGTVIKPQQAASWKRHQAQRQETMKLWGRANRDRTQIYCRNARAKRARAPGVFTLREWQDILATQNGACFDCGQPEKLSIGHMVPLARGGHHRAGNIVGQCMPCNYKQNAKLHWAAVAP
jgi:5-methylcytosine-specific restriction endonuclease McrA